MSNGGKLVGQSTAGWGVMVKVKKPITVETKLEQLSPLHHLDLGPAAVGRAAA